MSSSRITFGAVLGTVQSAATAVTGTLDAVTQGVGMLSSYVGQAADNQRIRQIADKETFIETLIQEKSFEESAQKLRVQKFCAQSTSHKEFYSTSYEKFSDLLRTKDDIAPSNP